MGREMGVPQHGQRRRGNRGRFERRLFVSGIEERHLRRALENLGCFKHGGSPWSVNNSSTGSMGAIRQAFRIRTGISSPRANSNSDLKTTYLHPLGQGIFPRKAYLMPAFVSWASGGFVFEGRAECKRGSDHVCAIDYLTKTPCEIHRCIFTRAGVQ